MVAILTQLLMTTLLAVILATGAWGAEADHEYGFLNGYGVSHRGFGETRSDIQTYDLIARYGYYLSPETGRGSWYQGRNELLAEIPLHLAVNRGGRIMTGGYLLGSWKFTGAERLSPYIFAGGGPLYVGLGLPSMGAKLCFSYQGGTGFHYAISRDTALTMEYRYHHVSNAGTAVPNEPLNSSKILFGLTFAR